MLFSTRLQTTFKTSEVAFRSLLAGILGTSHLDSGCLAGGPLASPQATPLFTTARWEEGLLEGHTTPDICQLASSCIWHCDKASGVPILATRRYWLDHLYFCSSKSIPRKVQSSRAGLARVAGAMQGDLDQVGWATLRS